MRWPSIILKRGIDIVGSTAGLILLSPALAAIAVLVRASDGGPAFYVGKRVGRDGREFGLIKFRSMRPQADKEGAAVTSKADDRVTPLGHVLRRTKLDELPQLINVIRGDMSLVGPRPESPMYVALYSDEQRQILKVRPGITGPASLKFRDEQEMLVGEDWHATYVDQVMPNKVAIDLEYLSVQTIRSDLSIIARTIASIFGRTIASRS